MLKRFTVAGHALAMAMTLLGDTSKVSHAARKTRDDRELTEDDLARIAAAKAKRERKNKRRAEEAAKQRSQKK